MLLPPVVAEVDGVDVVVEGRADLSDVVVGDPAEQGMDEIGMVVEVDHQRFHAPQRPRPLVERKPDLEDAETVGELRDLRGDVGEEAAIERIGKFITGEGRPREDLPFHIADVFIDRPVPYHAKHVPYAVLAHFGEEADVAAQFQQVVAERPFDIGRAVMLLELLLGLLGKAHRPGHVRRPLTLEDPTDDVSLLHGGS